jgi:hypothetical protein
VLSNLGGNRTVARKDREDDQTPFIGPPRVRVGGGCWCEG